MGSKRQAVTMNARQDSLTLPDQLAVDYEALLHEVRQESATNVVAHLQMAPSVPMARFVHRRTCAVDQHCAIPM
jgi:hypothetical protein